MYNEKEELTHIIGIERKMFNSVRLEQVSFLLDKKLWTVSVTPNGFIARSNINRCDDYFIYRNSTRQISFVSLYDCIVNSNSGCFDSREFASFVRKWEETCL